jgi:uncharacterized protein (TIGR03435 family)
MKLVSTVVLAVTLAAGVVDAQAPPVAASRPAFEVAAVRPNTSGSDTMRSRVMQGGRFEAINFPVIQLIQNAYELRSFQIIGAPSWLSDRYDVIAKAETRFPPTEPGRLGAVPAMLQSLLADRFALVAHRETRDMDIYALVRARADGQLGPRLRPSDLDCESIARTGVKPAPPPPIPGMRQVQPCGMRAGAGNVVASGAKLEALIANLSAATSRMVENRTGLTGAFDIDVNWAPDTSTDTNVPSLFTALQEQLGLKLESTRAPVEVLVIDSIAKPTPD